MRTTDVVGLTITAKGGAVILDWTRALAQVRREQPNGPDCDPVCYRTDLSAP
jgi:hypothetical protein